jgi:hypothetical protein
MSTSYPSAKQTFTDPAGTSTLNSPDHAGLHTDINDTVEAIQDTVGTTLGTNVLKDFAAGNFPIRRNASGAIQETVSGGTINNSTLGTPTIIGATLNNATFGTPAVTGGTATSITLTTPAFSAGAVNTADIADRAVTSRKIVFNRVAGTRSTGEVTTASGSLVELTGGSVQVIADVASDIWINFSAIAYGDGGAPQFTLVINGTADNTWNDFGGWFSSATTLGGFTARRLGFAAGTHTVRMQWRTSAGTSHASRIELIAYPIGTS